LNPADCDMLGLADGLPAIVRQGESRLELPVREMQSVPRGGAWLAGATAKAADLGVLVGPLSVEKV
jgi:hypothetical protein